MSSRKGLPDFRKMRHDRHFVEELSNESVVAIGMMIPVDKIETNREQPRSNLGDIAELAESIRARGVLEPLLVRAVQGTKTYQLIAGERRFHAAIEAGLEEVPCVEISATDQEALELALVENLQRKDLSPFEEAEGYRTLTEKYGYTHDQVASGVGKSRTTITETLKLLAIPPGIQDLCRHADITAKSILLLIARAKTIQEMERLVQQIAEGNLDREGSAPCRAVHRCRPHGCDRIFTTRSPAREGQGDSARCESAFKPHQALESGFHFRSENRELRRHEVIATVESLLAQLRVRRTRRPHHGWRVQGERRELVGVTRAHPSPRESPSVWQ